jgi:KipI family sensor histidine kinase inhibitor
MGDRALLAELGDTSEVHALAAAVRRTIGHLLRELVPGARTLLAVAHDPADLEQVADALATPLEPGAGAAGSGAVGRLIEVAVRYDGQDLEAVAGHTGIPVEQIPAVHADVEHTVAFFGFAPGFGYLDGLPAALRVPRLPSPRVRVEAGAVAIAGLQSVVYPGGTPGGWYVIGHADLPLWRPAHDPPTLFQPGDRVVFRDAR